MKISTSLLFVLLVLVYIIIVRVDFALAFAAPHLQSPFEPEHKLSNFSIAAVGDTGCGSSVKKLINEIKNKKYDLVLALGDLSYQNSADCWFKITTPIASKIKIVLGEHDHRPGALSEQYKKYFNLSQEYYSFNYQNVHFIALSTEIPFDTGSPQYNFVKNDLEAVTKNTGIKWIIVFSYRPQYSSPTMHPGSGDLRDIYHPLFQKYHVDLVLQAHNHNYQRSYPINFNRDSSSDPIIADNDSKYYKDSLGQVYITVGTGGAKLYKLSGRAPYVAAQYEGFGFLDITLTKNGRNLTGIFYSTADGSIEDNFTLLK